MAQLNITLNQEEILQLLSDDRDGAFKTLLQDSLNSILQAESSAQLGAEKYERTEERTDSRNGTRTRMLKTRIGTLELAVPRHRNVPFKTLVFDNYRRSEAALVASMAEMVVMGSPQGKSPKSWRRCAALHTPNPPYPRCAKSLMPRSMSSGTGLWIRYTRFWKWMLRISRYGKTTGSSPKH